VTEEAAVSEAIHAAAHPGRHHEDEDAAAADESGADRAVADKDAE
jgi:hypothetical protein